MNFEVVQRAVVLTDLVDSVGLTSAVGDVEFAGLMAVLEGRIRELIRVFGGREIDKTDGFFVVFEGSLDALEFALALNGVVEVLSRERGVDLRMRSGLHYGNLVLRRNPVEQVAGGAKGLDADGLTKVIAARLTGLAEPGQVLITRTLFDLIRENEAARVRLGDEVRWLAHGAYLLQGLSDGVEIFEVGYVGRAPLRPPVDKGKARRAILPQDEVVLGWRPATGQVVPSAPEWRVVRKLGEGGYGEVWLAEHGVRDARRVFKFCFDASRIRSLNREKFLLGVIQESLGRRDDIVAVEDWNTDVPPFFIALEYIALDNMATWLDKRGGAGPLPVDVILLLVRRTAVALEAAHSVGVLHKDIKPSNLLVGGPEGDPRVHLIDFGVGLYAPRGEDETPTSSSSSSTSGSDRTTIRTSSLAGSRMYLAPEVAEGMLPSVQADLFSLGVLLYQLLRGDLAVGLRVGWERDVADGFVAALIAGATDGDLDKRFKSVSEFIRQLDSLEERRMEAVARERDAAQRVRVERALEKQKRRRALYAAGLAVAVPLVFVSGVLAIRANRSSLEARVKAEEAMSARGRANELIGFMLEDLTGELRRTGQLPLMDKVTSQALTYFGSETSETLTANERFNRARGYYLLGEILYSQHRLDEADRSLELGRAMAQGLMAAHPQERVYRKLLGDVTFLGALVDRRSKDIVSSKRKLGEVIALREEHYGERPDDLFAAMALAKAYGTYAVEVGPTSGALMTKKAVDIGRGVLENARRPGAGFSEGQLKVWECEYADCLMLEGRSARTHGEREVALDESIRISERLFREDPGNFRFATSLLMGYTYAGSQHLCCSPERALPFLEKGDDMAKQLLSRDATNLEWRQVAARAVAARGIALAGLMRYGEAAEAARSVGELLDELVVENPKHGPVWTAYVENCLQWLTAMGLEGRFEEQVQEAERFVKVLKQVAAKGGEEYFYRFYMNGCGALALMTGNREVLRTAVEEVRASVAAGMIKDANELVPLMAGVDALLEHERAFERVRVDWDERDMVGAADSKGHLVVKNDTDEVFVVRLFEPGSEKPFLSDVVFGGEGAEDSRRLLVHFCRGYYGISVNGGKVVSLEGVTTPFSHGRLLLDLGQFVESHGGFMRYRIGDGGGSGGSQVALGGR